MFLWRVDNAAKTVTAENGNKLHVWAPPGPHWIEATVLVKTYELLQVSIPDPADQSKRIVVDRRVISGIDIQQYKKDYKVGGTPVPPGPGPDPTPDPDPDPIPGPGPSDPFAKHLFTLLKALGPSYSKEKALKIADNYEGVASKAVATNEVRSLQDFTLLTSVENGRLFTPDEAAIWGPKFFDPGLSQYQANLFKARNLTTTNIPGIAQLWRDTATAIRAAVF